MTTLNVYDGEFWFLFDDAGGFGPLEIYFNADESIHGDWRPNHDFSAHTELNDVTEHLSDDERKSIIALIDQLFAEYQKGNAE
jgi:hypothetical protein